MKIQTIIGCALSSVAWLYAADPEGSGSSSSSHLPFQEVKQLEDDMKSVSGRKDRKQTAAARPAEVELKVRRAGEKTAQQRAEEEAARVAERKARHERRKREKEIEEALAAESARQQEIERQAAPKGRNRGSSKEAVGGEAPAASPDLLQPPGQQVWEEAPAGSAAGKSGWLGFVADPAYAKPLTRFARHVDSPFAGCLYRAIENKYSLKTVVRAEFLENPGLRNAVVRAMQIKVPFGEAFALALERNIPLTVAMQEMLRKEQSTESSAGHRMGDEIIACFRTKTGFEVGKGKPYRTEVVLLAGVAGELFSQSNDDLAQLFAECMSPNAEVQSFLRQALMVGAGLSEALFGSELALGGCAAFAELVTAHLLGRYGSETALVKATARALISDESAVKILKLR